jgi:hypothetical protein
LLSHKLADFATLPAYGDSGAYWPGGVFMKLNHTTYADVQASTHNTNSYEKVTRVDCHHAHSVKGGPYQFQVNDSQRGDHFVFQGNDASLRNDVRCLSCHATHGSFASITVEDAARYHLSAGGTVQKNGSPWVVSTSDQAASASAVAASVTAHMLAQAGMPAFFDPIAATNSVPVGRCSSCHMAKTGMTVTFFSGLDSNGRTANMIGDVTSHIMKVAGPQYVLASISGASTWTDVMPNACGSCHVEYLFGK